MLEVEPHERTVVGGLDPDLAELLADLDPAAADASGTPEQRRAAAEALSPWFHGPTDGAWAPAVRAVDELVPAAHRAVPVRVYSPAGARADATAIVYLHGGGWVAGSLASYDADLRHLAHSSGRRVVAVDYRLAPEHPYPAGLDDCVGVIRALAGREGLAVAGDSAGGNLALESARVLAGEAVPIAALLLLYPVVARSAIGNASYRRNGSGYLLTEADMRFYWDAYDPHGASDGSRAEPAALPPHLPPTVLATAGFDPLHDEGLRLAERLLAAEVPLTYLPNPALTHGFQQMARIPTAVRALDAAYAAFECAIESAT